MRGSIRQRGKNSFQVVVEVAPRDANGKRHQKYFAVRGTKRDAQRRLRAILHTVDTGIYLEPSRMTLGTYLEQWLRDYAKPNLGGRTLERYEEIVRLHLVPALGHLQLSKLQPVHIQAHYTETLAGGRKNGPGGLSPTTVLHHHRVLREALKHALRLQLIARNPADAVEPPRKTRGEVKALDESGTRELLRVSQGSWLHMPILLAVATGMRRGEIMALRWADVDFEAATITVQRSLEVSRQGLRFKEPKSARSRRRIALPRFAMEELRAHRAEQKRERLRLGPAYQDNDLVCPAADGRPRNPDVVTFGFRDFLVRHQLPVVRFHDLRHGHATSLLRQNIHPKIVSERLGHANVSITLDVYSHVTPDMQREAAEKIDAVLGGDAS